MRVEALVPLGIAFVIVVLVLSLGSDVVDDIRDTQVTSTYHCGLNSTNGTTGTLLYDGCGLNYNVSTDGLTGISNISGKLGTIGLVLAIAVIIGVILTYMSFRQ